MRRNAPSPAKALSGSATLARGCQLTSRDQDILDALALRVKLFSIAQVAFWYWHGNSCQAARRLSRLVDAGYLLATSILAAPEIDLARPLIIWRPNSPVPSFGEVVKATRTRWVAPATTVPCIIASTRALARLGGARRLPRLTEGTHDLHVSQVYLRLRANDPQRARQWRGETQPCSPTKSNVKVPDATVRAAGRLLAIEVVGASYGVAKLYAFHEYCASNRMGYELW